MGILYVYLYTLLYTMDVDPDEAPPASDEEDTIFAALFGLFIWVRTHVHIGTYIRAHTIHAVTYRRAHAHTHAHTYTHTHAQVPLTPKLFLAWVALGASAPFGASTFLHHVHTIIP